MMLGIGKEAFIFVYAALSGIVVLLSYQALRVFRRLIRHHIVLINLEDFLYWVAVSIYLFWQMYKTTYGSIRWFFVLGVVCGILFSNFILSAAKKLFRKIKKVLEKK
ncbi:spore cortex biosynthesis protein YabQ [Luxibacter massiliensis]|uniref:spore cortex biosynthesis protein YabQ n=1 Tax=Luxibacter massiliensis TaxID=2219695 RepID=UPI0013DEA644|nr:spore cortex biosynthesis protein YabQ [Luxibacter massiliensis]